MTWVEWTNGILWIALCLGAAVRLYLMFNHGRASGFPLNGKGRREGGTQTVHAIQAPVPSYVEVSVHIMFLTGRWVWIRDPQFFIPVFQNPN